MGVIVCVLFRFVIMTTSNNKSNVFTAKTEVRKDESERIHAQPSSDQSHVFSYESVAAGLPRKITPKYIIRTPLDAPAPLSRPDFGRHNSVKLWRTPTGKLVNLGGKLPTSVLRQSIDENAQSQPKYIRLANGKLAKISTKRVFASLSRRPASPLCRTNHSVFENEGIEATSATAKITSCSEPIDVSTLINTPTTSHCSSLPNNKSIPAPIKTEPMEVGEVVEYHEVQQAGNHHQQTQKPMLEAVLSDVSSGSQVGDLVKLVDQPLFNDEIRANFLRKSCKICRTTIPSMKKNLLSLEARLGGLVETVQNLLIYLNPNDRKALELASAVGSVPLSNGNMKEFAMTSASQNASTASATYHINDGVDVSEKPSSYLLPVAIKADKLLESKIDDASRPTAHQFSTTSNVIGSLNFANNISLRRQSTTSLQRVSVVKGTRFHVADKRNTLRTVSKVKPSEEEAQLRIRVCKDVKSDCSFFNNTNVEVFSKDVIRNFAHGKCYTSCVDCYLYLIGQFA
ncbi:hypothetical protein DICVIV_07523 [Dictyocaulus viviparus]|uniref:Uncharacterized protein n=1 Tax=Dictyocaulus viviparus TaxID=29172 RepID=A0A0D8XPE0_DICVI|nr:hypothetical protein DICVIV_07523 [Dictyocaulus viviparus]